MATTINISNVTSGTIGGSGVFDKLMEAAGQHIQSEYASKRISATDYSKVYLGALESAMAQSIQFTLQADAAAAQVDATLAQTDILNEEKLKIIAETSLIGKQEDKIDQEILVLTQNVLNAIQEVLKSTAEVSLLAKQEDKLDEEILVLKQDVLNAVQDVLRSIAEISLLGKQEDKLDKEILRIVEEITLVNNKAKTELAQTQSISTGVIGAQRELYVKQKDGFDRDAEQKAAKIMSQNISVKLSTDKETASVPDGLANSDVKLVLDKLRAGINAI